jgi:hypothetical protein
MIRLRRTSSVACAHLRAVVSHGARQTARRILTFGAWRSAAASVAARPRPTSLTTAASAATLAGVLVDKPAMDRRRAGLRGDRAL